MNRQPLPNIYTAQKTSFKQTNFCVGSTTIILIFTIICTTIIGLIALMSATINMHMQEKATNNIIALAFSVGESEKKLAAIDDAITQEKGTNNNADMYFENICNSLENPEFEILNNNIIKYATPINEGQVLINEIQILPPYCKQSYLIQGRYIESTGQWELQKGNNIWSGNFSATEIKP